MRSSFVVGMFATALMMTGSTVSAQAAPVGTAGAIRAAADSLNLVESVQYIWLGHNYCWYDDGWNGPGWYVCDFGPWVSGSWWGGGYGWHHWHGGHPRHHEHREHREHLEHREHRVPREHLEHHEHREQHHEHHEHREQHHEHHEHHGGRGKHH